MEQNGVLVKNLLRTKDGRSFLDTELQFIKCDPHKEYITSLIKGKRKSYE